jgi:hypothetical protein
MYYYCQVCDSEDDEAFVGGIRYSTGDAWVTPNAMWMARRIVYKNFPIAYLLRDLIREKAWHMGRFSCF